MRSWDGVVTAFNGLLSFARELKAAGWYVDCRRNTRGNNGGVWRGRWVRREGACIYVNRHADGAYEVRATWWYGMRSLERAGSVGEVRALWLEIEADLARGGRAEQAPPAPVTPEFEGQLDLFDALAGVSS